MIVPAFRERGVNEGTRIRNDRTGAGVRLMNEGAADRAGEKPSGSTMSVSTHRDLPCGWNGPGTPGRSYPFSGISYEKNVQERDSGKCIQCARSARRCSSEVRCNSGQRARATRIVTVLGAAKKMNNHHH